MKRVWWWTQGFVTASVGIFGLSVGAQLLFGSPPPEAITAIMPVWWVTLGLTVFNTVMMIRKNYREPL